jgi:hypothetical protein
MREDSTTRAHAIAAAIVKAVSEGDDLGDSLSLALGTAADELGSIEALVQGRPGSWEANHVRLLAVQYASVDGGLMADMTSPRWRDPT